MTTTNPAVVVEAVKVSKPTDTTVDTICVRLYEAFGGSATTEYAKNIFCEIYVIVLANKYCKFSIQDCHNRDQRDPSYGIERIGRRGRSCRSGRWGQIFRHFQTLPNPNLFGHLCIKWTVMISNNCMD